MGIKGHQISISLATVQTWVLMDTKSVYHLVYGTVDMGIKGHQIYQYITKSVVTV